MSQVCASRAGAREWVGLGLLALPTTLLGLDVTVLYLAAPSIANALQPSASQLLWIMDAYGFVIAAFLITMGTLGDRIGRRRLLMIGAVGFGLASVVAAFAPSASLLIAARALLGLAGATLMPSTLALIRTMFVDTRQRALAVGVWATMFALGMAAGPIVGGALLAHYWWGSAFLVAVPVVTLLVVAAPRVLPEYKAPSAGRIDLPSVAWSLVAIVSIVYAVKHLASSGLDGQVPVALVLGVSAGVVFVRRQLVLSDPLLDVRLFSSGAFSAALTILLVGLVGVGGVMYLVTQYLQLVEALSPTVAGLWMGPPALAMLVAGIGAPLLARWIRPGMVMAGTLALSLLGYGLLATVGPGQAASVVCAFALVYLGLGVIAALGTDMVIGAAPVNKAGSAAALSETVQELGLAVGVAVLGSLTTVVYRGRFTDPTGSAGDSMQALVGVEGIPDAVVEEARAAFTVGMNVSALVAGLAIGGVAILCARTLRHIHPFTESP